MEEIKQLQSLDSFFYYGLQDLEYENKYDLFSLVTQSKRKLFFYRSYGGGAEQFLNFPAAFMIDIGIRYAIASSVAKRNSQVTDGRDNSKDRQILVSQETIDVTREKNGDISVNVGYIDKFNLENTNGLNNLSISIGVNT